MHYLGETKTVLNWYTDLFFVLIVNYSFCANDDDENIKSVSVGCNICNDYNWAVIAVMEVFATLSKKLETKVSSRKCYRRYTCISSDCVKSSFTLRLI